MWELSVHIICPACHVETSVCVFVLFLCRRLHQQHVCGHRLRGGEEKNSPADKNGDIRFTSTSSGPPDDVQRRVWQQGQVTEIFVVFIGVKCFSSFYETRVKFLFVSFVWSKIFVFPLFCSLLEDDGKYHPTTRAD